MPAAHAFLTMEEVLSVRLFTGPAYQPINDFLRGNFPTPLAGGSDADWAYVTGLPERAQLITVGQEFVSDGETVRAVPESAVGTDAAKAS